MLKMIKVRLRSGKTVIDSADCSKVVPPSQFFVFILAIAIILSCHCLFFLTLSLAFSGKTMLTTLLTHFSLETLKRVTGKQCRPRSDAAECGL